MYVCVWMSFVVHNFFRCSSPQQGFFTPRPTSEYDVTVSINLVWSHCFNLRTHRPGRCEESPKESHNDSLIRGAIQARFSLKSLHCCPNQNFTITTHRNSILFTFHAETSTSPERLLLDPWAHGYNFLARAESVNLKISPSFVAWKSCFSIWKHTWHTKTLSLSNPNILRCLFVVSTCPGCIPAFQALFGSLTQSPTRSHRGPLSACPLAAWP